PFWPRWRSSSPRPRESSLRSNRARPRGHHVSQASIRGNVRRRARLFHCVLAYPFCAKKEHQNRRELRRILVPSQCARLPIAERYFRLRRSSTSSRPAQAARVSFRSRSVKNPPTPLAAKNLKRSRVFAPEAEHDRKYAEPLRHLRPLKPF